MPVADNYDWSGAQAKLKSRAGQWYDDSMLEDLKRNAKEESDIDPWVERIGAKATLRGGNEANSTYRANGAGGVTVGPSGRVNTPTGSPGSGSGSAGTGASVTGAGGADPLSGFVQQMIAQQKANADRYDKWRDTVRTDIMDRYHKLDTPVDMSDPILSKAAQVHNAASQRALMQGREAMAARGAAEGMGTGAIDAAVGGMYEDLGKDQSAYESGLMMDETRRRQAEVNDLLHLGTGVLTADESRMLQDKLGTADVALRSTGLANQYDIGRRGLDLQGRGLDLQRYGIDLNNQHFYDEMGNNNGLQEYLLNQYIMSSLAGGGA